MRISLIACLIVAFYNFADAAPSRVWWPQWEIQSSEELYDETKYTSYPIPLMLDGDPKTAWVYSAKKRKYDKQIFASPYGFIFTPSTPLTLDSLRLMNGQNLSRARFLANHRALKIRVTQELPDKKKVTTETKLSDTMGWHAIKLPRHKTKSLKIELLDFKRGNSKNSDVCISELELRDNGKKIDWRMPRLLMFTDGFLGCDASYLITRHGRVLDGIATDVGYEDKWNSSGRYAAGLNGGGNYVWIADVWSGKTIREIKYPENSWPDYKWRNAQTLVIEEPNKENKIVRRRYFKAPNFG